MASPEIIEGAYRVVASGAAQASAQRSPNRRRAAARILAWNLIGLAAVIALPLLF